MCEDAQQDLQSTIYPVEDGAEPYHSKHLNDYYWEHGINKVT